jgi:hypothetical protein
MNLRVCVCITRWGVAGRLQAVFFCVLINTGLLKMIVGVLTTCQAQYTWDRSKCVFFYLIEQHSKVFVTYLTDTLYVHPLWFYKHQHDNRVRSTQKAFSLPFAAILVNCAPSGEMHNYCTPHIIKWISEFLYPSVQLHTPILSVLCMTSCQNTDNQFE